MVAPRKYPDELRERATRMAIDARKNPATRTGAYKRVADQLGVHPEALRTWVNARRSTRACARAPRATTHRVSPNSNAKSKSYAERTRS
jgi:transposase-like protein